jgi:hypothetical protein
MSSPLPGMERMLGGLFPMSAHSIYQRVHEGPGPSSMYDAREAALTLSDSQQDRADQINRLAEKISAGWQGEAGAGAAGAATPLAKYAIGGSHKLVTTGNTLDEQGTGFEHVKNTVKPVPENAPESNFFNDLAPWETDLDKEIKQYQADSQHNIAAYDAYDGSSLDNENRLPQDFGELTDSGSNITVTPPGEKPPPPPPERPPEVGGSGDGSGTGGGTRSGSSIGGPVGESRGAPELGQIPQTTSSAGFQDIPRPTGFPPGTPVGSPGGPAPNQGFGPISGNLFGPGGPGGGPGGAGGRPGGGFGPGGAGAGRGGGFGPVGSGSGQGAGAGAAAGQGPGAAGRGGAGAAGGRGAGAGGMGGGMGGGRGQGGEDEEHQRASYLQEADPEAVFGTDQLTAPPVIE